MNHHGATTQLVRYVEIILSLQLKYLGFGIYLELLYPKESNVSAHNDYNHNDNIDHYHNHYHNDFHHNYNT